MTKKKEQTMTKERHTTASPSAPTVFDSELFKKTLMEQVRQGGGTAAVGGRDFFNRLVKTALEVLLQVEMEEHLGYPKHSATGRGSGNSRNGTDTKKVRGDFGEVQIETPRDRNGTFDPKIVGKRQKSLNNFAEKIISLYARGMTTREIEAHLREMYGIDVSAEFISRAVQELQGDIVDWQGRPLLPMYPIVYVDGLRVSVRVGNNAGTVIKKCVYIVLGITPEGVHDVLGLWVEETEGSRFWLKVFNDLKARGVKDILILCGDGLTGLDKAVESVYPKADLQLCVVHQIRNALKFVSYKDRKAFCADMRLIYCAPTIEAAEQALQALEEKWGKRYPASVASWRNNWQYLSTFFKYPVDIRKIIYTTNSIESLNGRLRKNTSNRKIFPNDEAIIRLLYLNIRNFSHRWTARQGWDSVMSQLSIMYPDRVRAEAMEAAA